VWLIGSRAKAFLSARCQAIGHLEPCLRQSNTEDLVGVNGMTSTSAYIFQAALLLPPSNKRTTMENMFCCESVKRWQTTVEGSKGRQYQVTWGKNHRNPNVMLDYNCTCPAYEFGKGAWCKHIKQARMNHCGWSSNSYPQKPVPLTDNNGQDICPECGSEVYSVEIVS
jgi:hypothetical protein